MKVTTVLSPLALAGATSAWMTWLPEKYDRASFDVNPFGPFPNCRWMARLPDNTPLTALSIPGTHNTWGGDLVHLKPRELHQCARPMHQVLAGVRFFDMHLHEKNGHLWITDDTLFGQNELRGIGHRVNFPFLGHIRLWFENFRSEGLIMRIRRHPKDIAGGAEQLAKFQKAWNENMRPFDPHPYVYHGLFGGTVLRNADFSGPNGTLPTLGQIRNRVLLLLDFEGADEVPVGGRRYDGFYFPAVQDKLFSVEDDTPGKLNNLEDISKKWRRVSRHLDAAMYARSNNTKGYITYITAGGMTPNEYAPPPAPAEKPGLFERIKSSIKSFFQINIISQPAIPHTEINHAFVEEQPPVTPKVPNKLFVMGNGFLSPASIAGGKGSLGPKRYSPVKGMNLKTLEKLAPLVGTTHDGKLHRAGIVVMDFPGRNLIDAIVGLNFQKPKLQRQVDRA